MSFAKPTYEELERRCRQAEAQLETCRRTVEESAINRSRAETALSSFEWMLSGRPDESNAAASRAQPYGDLTELNTCRQILDAVGPDLLEDIVSDYLDLLGTSSAVYEKNGDYAFGIFSSGWCRLLDRASRERCGTPDNRAALDSGRWLCHESCWQKASRAAIETAEPVDVECAGGLRLYAVPIRAGEEIVGSINFGYGDPPQEPEKLRELAARYEIPPEDLQEQAKAYPSRPAFIVELAKKRLRVSARLIGEIVHRKRIHEKLRERERYLSAILDTTMDGFAVLDSRGHIISVNDAFCAMSGYSRDELFGLHVNELNTEATPEEIQSRIQRVKDRGGERFESRHRRKDGTFFPLEISTTWLPEHEGRFICFCRDLTNRKETERLLRHHSHLLANTPNAVYVSDEQGRLVYANAASFLQTGISCEDLLGKRVWDLDACYDPERYASVLSQLSPGGQVRLRTRHRRADGSEFPVEMSLSMLEDDGKTLMCGIARDLTEQDAHEASLKRTQFSVDSAPVSIFWASPDGAFTYVNHRAAETLGYTRDELLGMRVEDIDPNFPRETRAAQWQMYKQQGEAVFESLHRRKDGTTFPVRVHSYYLEFMGEEMEVAEIEDITERKQAEKRLRIMAEMLDTAPSAITVHDEGGRFLYANRETFALHGCSEAEFMATNLHELDVPESAALLAERFRRIRETGEARFEVSHYRKDGSTFPLEVLAKTIEWDGQTAVLSIATDISQRKQAEKTLRESMMLLDEAQHIARLGGWKANPHTDYLEWTDGIHAIIEAPRDYQPGLAEGLEYYLPEYVPLIREKVETCLATGEQFVMECQLKTSTGKLLWAELRGIAPVVEGDRSYVMGTLQDISERKRAEQRNELLTSIIRRSQDFVGVAGPDTRALYVNPAGQAMVGLEGDEAVADTRIEDYFFPEDLPFVRQTILPALDKEGRWSGEFKFRHFKTGEPVYVLYDLFRIEDPQAAGVVYYTTVTRDITDRKRTEEALKESERRYRTLVEHFPNGAMFLFDRDIRYTFCGGPALRRAGLDTQKLVGRTVWEVFPPEVSEVAGPVDRAIFEGKIGQYTVPYQGRIYENWAVPIRAQDGSVVEGAVFAVDATERLRAEEELRKRENQLQRIFEFLPVGLWFADKEGTLVRGNPAGIRIWGAEPRVPMSEHAVFKARRLPSGEEVRPEEWSLARTVREGVTVVDELLEIQAFDGKRRTILNYSAPVLDEQGNLDCAIVVNLDVSDRMALEAQLRQAQKMESVGRLAGGVAHDFNNMLAVILGHVEMALEQMSSTDPLHFNLDQIREAAERSASLTRQLLAFARKQTVAPRVIDLNETVDGMLQMLRRLIGEDIDLVFSPGASVWPVRIDPTQVDQLLANLCVNARDAIADVGKVTIETGNATFDDAFSVRHADCRPGPYVMLAVSDDGCGMDAPTLEKLFEPFFTTKQLGEGTGLGLATVYGIVRQNHGFIDVSSEPGTGTRFCIYLPRYTGKADKPLEAPPVSHAARGHETVLLVEDEPAILQLISRMLEDHGYTVVSALSPGEAVRKAELHAGEIDLLITDVVMPEMNGRDLARNVLRSYPACKRLFMSGYTAEVLAPHGVLDEGVNFIQKPFSMKDLALKVRAVLDES